MTTIGIVLPTLPERWEVFDRTYAAFEASCPGGWVFDIVVPDPQPTVGLAWRAGVAELLEDFDGDYLLLGSDDATPRPGWAEVMVPTIDAGFVPAPRLERPDGSVEACGSMGFGVLLPEAADCTPVRSTGIIGMARSWWTDVGPVGEGHYAVDDLWCWQAAQKGHSVLYRSGMVFTHYNDTTAARHVREQAQEHNLACIRMMAAMGPQTKAARTLADDPALTLTHYGTR